MNQKDKLVLGTAQLGMRYGLSNTHGQPNEEEAFRILDTAFAAGLTTIDTAWAYGTAEDVLGSWIASRSLSGKVRLITKMKPHALNDYPDGTKGSDVVQFELEKSLKRLQVDSVDGYLFHSPHYIYLAHMVKGMQKAKEKGLVKNIGVSTYDEKEALQAVELGVDYVQVPYNAFDQRLDATHFFEIAEKNNVTVFARSPFLQGVLVLKPEALPEHLFYLRPHLSTFIEIAKSHNLNQASAALFFALEASRARHIVFGIELASQLNDDMANGDSPEKHESFIAEVKSAFSDLNRGAINPSLWSKIKQKN